MHFKLVILYLFVLMVKFSLPLSAQNLIGNGDFETFGDCPSDINSFRLPPNSPNHISPNVISDWYLVLDDNPDVSNDFSNFKPEYFNQCDIQMYPDLCDFIGKYHDSINYIRPMPIENRGGFIGMKLWARTSVISLMDMSLSVRKDFIQKKLNKPLIPGQYYNLTFYYIQGFDHQVENCAAEKFVNGPIDRIGFTFSDTFLYSNNLSDLLFPNITPLAETSKDNWLESKYIWKKVSMNFFATNDNQILVFGNFHPTMEYSKFFDPNIKAHYEGYYFFDNFQMRQYNDDVFENINPTKYIGACPYDSLYIKIFESDGHFWNTGDTSDRIPVSSLNFVDDTAISWVKTIKDGLLYIDSFIVYRNQSHDLQDDDSTICSSDSVSINLKEIYPNYAFFDQNLKRYEYGPYIDNQTSGTYQYLYKRTDSCSDHYATYTFNIIVPNKPNLPDTIIKCEGDSFTIVLDEEFDSALWNTGEMGREITVKETNVYSYQIKTKCQLIQDSVFVYFKKCEHCVQYPNAFTPNNDGLNDLFKPLHSCPEINQYQLYIYDRWGNMIFKSYQVENGWDGSINGKPADMGVYYYQTNYKGNISGPVDNLSGEIHLIR